MEVHHLSSILDWIFHEPPGPTYLALEHSNWESLELPGLIHNWDQAMEKLQIYPVIQRSHGIDGP